jgi:hypothetical protein
MKSKSHDKDVNIAEGLSMGSVHPAHTKMSVRDSVKHDSAELAAGFKNSVGVSADGSHKGLGTKGGKKATSHPGVKMDSKVQKKAHAFNTRSQAGNANTMGGE